MSMTRQVYANGAPGTNVKKFAAPVPPVMLKSVMPYPDPFRAVILQNVDGNVRASIKQLPASSLPDADTLVSIAYSSLNYKDALAVTSRGEIARRYPDGSGYLRLRRHPSWNRNRPRLSRLTRSCLRAGASARNTGGNLPNSRA